jgi:hypothetical protein
MGLLEGRDSLSHFGIPQYSKKEVFNKYRKEVCLL